LKSTETVFAKLFFGKELEFQQFRLVEEH